MGGNAIKIAGQSICSRLTAADYLKVKAYALQRMAAVLTDVVCTVVLEAPGKETFGDLDLLIAFPKSASVAALRDAAKAAFSIEDDRRIVDGGGKMVSVALECTAAGVPPVTAEAPCFQVDLIVAGETQDEVDMSCFYFSYGDLGAIIGKMCNYYGLKFGAPGLWCEVLEHSVFPDSAAFDVRKTIGKVHLASTPAEICAYLGLDYAAWQTKLPLLKTTDEMAVVFDWVVESPLFSPEVFRRMNGGHRQRKGVRPLYQAFLAHIGLEADAVGNAGENDGVLGETGGGRVSRQRNAIAHFGKEAAYEALVEGHRVATERRAKFTGGDLTRHYAAAGGPRLKGQEVGDMIDAFKAALAAGRSETFDGALDMLTRDRVQAEAKKFAEARASSA